MTRIDLLESEIKKHLNLGLTVIPLRCRSRSPWFVGEAVGGRLLSSYSRTSFVWQMSECSAVTE
jgi:hypothetical protein